MNLTKQDIDKVRNIEGFPIAKDEDIIALSNPPYYTACPNPFIEDFIKENGTLYDETTDDYHREPFAADVSEGKNDPIYNAHTYHTKVPHKAIMRYILHYTEPGDIVFDGFCGTGMTGVAAQMCGCPDFDYKWKIEQEMPNIKWGARKAILNDLSPAAVLIAYNYNTSVNVSAFEEVFNRILRDCEKECGWMYETLHTEGSFVTGIDGLPIKGHINYTVWSDVFLCPNCGKELVFWDVAVDKKNSSVKDVFYCVNCKSELTKRECKHAVEIEYDDLIGENVTIAKQIPVLINYSVGKKRYEKEPDNNDFSLIEKIKRTKLPEWVPTNELPHGYNTEQPKRSHGLFRVHQFYTRRNLHILSLINEKIKDHPRYRVLFQSVNFTLCSKIVRYNMGNRGNGPVSGTLYVPSLVAEPEIFKLLEGKLRDFCKAFGQTSLFEGGICNNASATDVSNIGDISIDYIFTDPPFGGNLNYSELSFIWETWLKSITNPKTEAIMNNVQGKGLVEYQTLMEKCFKEYFRILKPNRWMTVEFHNSQNAVWTSIQEALQKAGFIIADVRTLDKKQGSFKQVTTNSAVKQDLIISAYKPKESFRRDFFAQAGNEETAWAFVRQHLSNLNPVIVKAGKIEIVAERQAFLLFDRMVAYHIMNGISVPLDAIDFYKGLDARFMQRDGMYFLHDQVNEYDIARITNEVDLMQTEMFVTNEKSAITWLYAQLTVPHTYAEMQPKFMQEVRSIEKYEKMPELSVLLEDNFLEDEAGRWYIPDVTKVSDVMKLREKRLLKEFEEYVNSTGKLKLFRAEALRVGFAKLWKDKNYALIVKTAERLPESVIQEDDKLLMYYDISLSRV